MRSSISTNIRSFLHFAGFKPLTKIDKMSLYGLFVALFGNKLRECNRYDIAEWIESGAENIQFLYENIDDNYQLLELLRLLRHVSSSYPLCKELAKPHIINQLLTICKYQYTHYTVESQLETSPMTNHQADCTFIYIITASTEATIMKLLGHLLPHCESIHSIPFKKLKKFADNEGYPIEIMVAHQLACLLLRCGGGSQHDPVMLTDLFIQHNIHSLMLKLLRNEKNGEFRMIRIAIYRMMILYLGKEEEKDKEVDGNTNSTLTLKENQIRNRFKNEQDVNDALKMINYMNMNRNRVRRWCYLYLPYSILEYLQNDECNELLLESIYGLFSGIIYGGMLWRNKNKKNGSGSLSSSSSSSSSSPSSSSSKFNILLLGISWMILRSFRWISPLFYQELFKRVYKSRYTAIMDIFMFEYPSFVARYFFIKTFPIIEAIHTSLLVFLRWLKRNQQSRIGGQYIPPQMTAIETGYSPLVYLNNEHYRNYRSQFITPQINESS